MRVSKGLGSNIKNVWLTCEKIRFIFGLFFSWFFFVFCFFKFENALLPTTLWGFTKPTMSILELVKNKGVGVLSTMSSIYSMSSMLTKFDQQNYKKQWKEARKQQRNEQLTLAYIWFFNPWALHYAPFLVQTNWFSLQNDVM